MKMKAIVDASPALKKIAAQDLPVRVLYSARRLLDEIDTHLGFYDEKRAEIVMRHCENVEGHYIPRPGEAAEIDAAVKELLDIDLDMSKFVPITLPADGLRLSYTDLKAIEQLDGLINIDVGEGDAG